MICGVGIDLVGISGFSRQLSEPASSFAAVSFTDSERRYAQAAVSSAPEMHLAARYAAKEAALKALDAACARAAVSPPAIALKDIEVVRDNAGRPSLVLHAQAAMLAEKLGIDRVLVSLSHDEGHAVAVVVLETLS